MTVQELRSHRDVTPLWTEACPAEHGVGTPRGSRQGGLGLGLGLGSAVRPARGPGAPRLRPPTRPVDRRAVTSRAAERGRPVAGRSAGSVRAAGLAPVSPGRRVLSRPSATARACRVEAPVSAGVVDDVPTWALLTCGILFGILMLLAVAFLGGPAYA